MRTKRSRNQLVGIARRRNERVASPKKLDDRQRAWIEDGIVDEDWVRATRRHYPTANPFTYAKTLLATPKLRSAVETARRHALTHAEVEKAWVIRRLIAFVTADPNDLVEGRRVACRYCHGLDHRYQFRTEELRQERQRHIAAQMQLPELQRVEFDDHGGGGYTTRRDPDPECPECDGDGVFHVVFKDTRYLSAGGQLLFDGFETKADGSVKVKLRDRLWAEQALLRHAGVGVERKVVLVRRLDVANLTDDELRAGILEAEAAITVELEDEEFEEVDDQA